MTNTTTGVRRIGLKGIFGIVSCLIGGVVVYFGSGVGTESPKKEASASANPAAMERRQKPVHAMNVALGNMVFLAHDLGFSVRNAKDSAAEASRIAGRIESQLQDVREQYRQEVVKNPTLAGSLTLQFNIAPSGEVSQVRELSSRLNDSDFKKAISAAVSTWSFAEIVDENLTVTCPLLFVNEGMDITTLVRWEKSLSNSGDKPVAGAPAIPAQQTKLAATATTAKTASTGSEKKKLAAGATPIGKEFQIKYPTALRRYPNFTADSLATFTIGTKVIVVGKQGEWLEVESANTRGFIRQEFVVPVEVARK